LAFQVTETLEKDLGVQRVLMELMTRENLDLSIFNNDVANDIYGRYLGTALPLTELLQKKGFPGMSFPSTNAYRHFARYTVDVMGGLERGEGIHPMMLSLMRSNLNIKEYATKVSDISIGRTRIRNPISLENAVERTKRIKVIDDVLSPNQKTAVNYLAFDPVNDKGKIKTILTWDTETTGLSPDARVRNVALVKRQVRVLENGTTELVSAPEVIMTKHFRSDMMDLAHVYRNGKPIPLSVGTILSEMGPDAFNPDGSFSATAQRAMQAFGGDGVDGGAIALKDLREILEAFMGKSAIVGEVHRLEGHNSLAFDIDKLYDTIKSLPAYNDLDNEDAKAVKELWGEFTLKRAGPANVRDAYYAQDTLDTTKIAMDIERNNIFRAVEEELVDTAPELKTQAAHFYASIFSVDPELLGTKSAESLENLFLNTNFLDLLEDVGKQDSTKLQNLFKLMETRGIHTGEIDALLNAYISEFVNNGQLHIRRFPTPGNIASDVTSAELGEFIEKNNDRITRTLSSKGYLRGVDEKYSEFADFLRTRFRKSSAITPVTNVADLQGLSNEMFDYLSTTEEGRQKMTIAISAAEAKDLGVSLEGAAPGSNAGSVFYADNDYLFKDYKSGKVTSLKKKTTEVGELIKQKMEAARAGVTEAVDIKARDGTVLGTVRNVNKRANDIVDIGVRNVSHTEFNEMFTNISALNSQIATYAPPLNAEALQVGATVTDRFYGIGSEEIKKTDPTLEHIAKRNLLFDKVRSGDELTEDQVQNLQRSGLLRTSVNTGLQRGEAYMAEVRASGLPYGALDSRSRLMGVAKSRATGSFIGKTLLSGDGVRFGNEETARLVNINEIGNALNNPRAVQLGDLADTSPLTYTIGQGSEDVFGITYQTKKSTQSSGYRSNDYVRNSYIRITAGEADGLVSSEKITMLANDMNQLELLDKNGKLVKFGSEEFYASSMNDFFESYVHPGTSEARMPATINMVFNPRNLEQSQYEHLANQVIGLQMQTYQKMKGEKYITKTIQQDFDAVTQRIFGKNYDQLKEAGIDITEIFTKDTLLDQKEVVKRIQGLKIANAAEAAENYKKFVTSTAKEIETDGIIGFSIKDKGPTVKINGGQNPVTDIREIERLTGVESNPTDTFSRSKRARLVATIEQDMDVLDPATGVSTGAKENQVLGGIFSPTADTEMEAAARKTEAAARQAASGHTVNLTDADIAQIRRAEDLKALKNLQEIQTAPQRSTIGSVSEVIQQR